MPETKPAGLPTDEELEDMAIECLRDPDLDHHGDVYAKLREVLDRTLHTSADRFEDSIATIPGRYTHAAQRVISELREAAAEAERV